MLACHQNSKLWLSVKIFSRLAYQTRFCYSSLYVKFFILFKLLISFSYKALSLKYCNFQIDVTNSFRKSLSFSNCIQILVNSPLIHLLILKSYFPGILHFCETYFLVFQVVRNLFFKKYIIFPLHG